jgi:hypothetical protein
MLMCEWSESLLRIHSGIQLLLPLEIHLMLTLLLLIDDLFTEARRVILPLLLLLLLGLVRELLALELVLHEDATSLHLRLHIDWLGMGLISHLSVIAFTRGRRLRVNTLLVNHHSVSFALCKRLPVQRMQVLLLVTHVLWWGHWLRERIVYADLLGWRRYSRPLFGFERSLSGHQFLFILGAWFVVVLGYDLAGLLCWIEHS